MEEKERLEGSLIEFFQAAWPEIDPSPFALNWHLSAIAEHLEAVSRGEIRKLIINIPPRHSKTLLCGVAWQAWTWAQNHEPEFPLMGPQAKFLYLSYGDQLSLDTATTARRLIQSEWYQKRWPIKLRQDQEAKAKFDNYNGGTRISASFGGQVLGRGGDIKIIDDPHKLTDVESEIMRKEVLQTYDETLKSRVTDPRHTAEVIIMHRVHEGDLTGHILSDKYDTEFVHLMLPAEFDPARKCTTVLGWEDPRTQEGEMLWPDRWGAEELAPFKRIPYLWSGQYQQAPTPRGGGIFKREWWQLWEPDDGKWPQFDLVVASLDGAFTEKEENDPSAMTVWGLWKDKTTGGRFDAKSSQVWQVEGMGLPKVMLMKAWRKHLQMHGTVVEPNPGESYRSWRRRAEPGWGLVEWVAETCRFRGSDGKIISTVDKLLIENKASGKTVAQEIQRLYTNEGWMTELIEPKGDKVARAHAVVPFFANGLIYAPDREWSDLVIDEMGVFPKGRYDDLTDSATQALRYLRSLGLIQRAEDIEAEDEYKSRHRSKKAALYPA